MAGLVASYLGKRNKMINYKETKRATLRILEPSATELFNQLAVSEKELTFQRPTDKDSDFRTYSMLSLLETLKYTLPVHVGDIKADGTVMEREKTLKNMRAKYILETIVMNGHNIQGFEL